MPRFSPNIESYTIPAGEYYVGDPCYGVPDARWMEWLEAADYENVDRFLVADLDDRHTVVGVRTAYGDGEYYDQAGRAYPVDAGLIGVVPVELVEEDEPSGMHRVTFDSDFQVAYSGEHGTIHIGTIDIETDPDPNPDYDGGW